jgi:DNA-binding protein YbaB
MPQRPSPDDIRAMMDALPADLETFQRNLRDSLYEVVIAEYTGSAADGRVEATCNGFGVLTRITIHPTARRELDNLTLGDAVAEAVRNAEDAGRRAFQEGLGATTLGGRSLTEFVPRFLTD